MRLEAELREVRSKAGSRLKELVTSGKALEEELTQSREAASLSSRKMEALEASLEVRAPLEVSRRGPGPQDHS